MDTGWLFRQFHHGIPAPGEGFPKVCIWPALGLTALPALGYGKPPAALDRVGAIRAFHRHADAHQGRSAAPSRSWAILSKRLAHLKQQTAFDFRPLNVE